MRYRLDIEYLGTDFFGWQCQRIGQTIQTTLQEALTQFFQEPIKIIAASRTDSGVHAKGQVCIFDVQKGFVDYKFLRAMRALLPDTIAVKEVHEVASDFHPIECSRAKAYRYLVWENKDWVSPFVKDYVWHVYGPIDIEAMQQAAELLLGQHDFKSFAASDGGAKTTVRQLLSMDIHKVGHRIEFWLIGDGFLKQMVRNIVGTLVQVGLGKLSQTAVPGILAACNRCAAGPTAPPQGLSLMKVFYEEPIDLTSVRVEC